MFWASTHECTHLCLGVGDSSHTAWGQTLRVSSPPGALHAPPATPAVAAGLTATTVLTLSTALGEGKADGRGDAALRTLTNRAAWEGCSHLPEPLFPRSHTATALLASPSLLLRPRTSLFYM